MAQPQKIRLFLQHAVYGTVEISEPFKTDAFAYTVEQDKGRYGRDITYGGEEVSLHFPDAYGIATSAPQTLPSGTVVNHLTMGLPYILAAWRETGFETVMSLIAMDYYGNTISTGELDFSEASFKTDNLTYVECKVIQDSRRAEIKRRAETNIDLFSLLDIKGNAIQPIATSGIFLKAVPTPQSSSWKTPTGGDNSGLAVITSLQPDIVNRSGINTAVQSVTYDIERSLGYISTRYALVVGANGGYYPNGGNNYTYLQAANELTNVTIELSNIIGYTEQQVLNGVGVNVTTASGRTRLLVNVGILGDYNNPREQYMLWQKDFSYTDTTDEDPETTVLPTSHSLTIPLVLRGEYVWIYYEQDASAEFDDTSAGATYLVTTYLENIDVGISAISTAVSSVTQAVRYHDIYKQILISINGSTLVAPRTDTGFLADVYAFNGNLLRGILDRPFNTTWKDRSERLEAFNLDYQINTDNVFIGSEEDFYPNREIIQLLETPDNDYFIETNERATCNLMEMKLQGYLNQDVQDSEEAPTFTAVHTETQYTFPNDRVENILSVDVKDILDPLTIENARKLAITQKPTTTGKYDEKIMLIDTVGIPEDSRWQFTAYLQQRVDEDGNLRILNTGIISSQDSENNYFDWRTLGFNVGSEIEITFGDNAGTYTVLSYEYSLIILEPVSGTPTFDGLGVLTIDYPLDNVLLMNRTTEGFSIAVEGFGNQRFTPKRLALLRERTMANICRYHTDGEIRVSKPPINADFTTQLTSESLPVVENEAIPVSALDSPIITANVINTRAAMTLAQAKTVLDAMETIHDDGTIGGYITTQGASGNTDRTYPKKIGWLMLFEYAEISGEEKQGAH